MKKPVLADLAVAVALPTAGLGAVASAQPDYHGHGDYHGQGDNRWQGGPDHRSWDASQAYRSPGHDHDRAMHRDDYVYRGHDGRYYCRRNDGTTGLVVGGIGGALLGNAIGGNTLGTLVGAAGGAALGRSIDRGHVRCR